MQADSKNKQSNPRLRFEREARGWTQQYVAEHLGADMNIVSRWECGERKPGPYYRQKLIELFGKSAVELGVVEAQAPSALASNSSLHLTSPQAAVPGAPSSRGAADVSLDTHVVDSSYSSPVTTQTSPIPGSGNPQGFASVTTPVGLLGVHHSLDVLHATTGGPPEQRLGAWLALGASDLAQLFEEGWTLEEVFTSLQMLQKVVQIMSEITRRQLFELGALALVRSIPIPEGRHISEEDRVRLCQALSECIAAAWKQLYSVSNAQALTVAQALLFLVQRSHSLLYPKARSLCYTGVFGQIGITLHFQERNDEALQAYRSSYIAALEAGEPWYVVQSLICQADSYTALSQYDVAIQAIEEALRIIGEPTDETMIRARAHLLTCWADNAMMLQDFKTTQDKLDTAGSYLDRSVPNEEFDQASWFLLAGKYALKTGNYTEAKDCFQNALMELPQHWILRRVMTAIGLAMAYAGMRERDESMAIAENLVPMVKTINAQMTNRWFSEYLRQDLRGAFPTDAQVHKFVADTYKGFPQLASFPRLRS